MKMNNIFKKKIRYFTYKELCNNITSNKLVFCNRY